MFLALGVDPPFVLSPWFLLAKILKDLKWIYLQLCFLRVFRHRQALGYGTYSESYSSVLIVTLVVWNLEHCLFNELHSKGLISILIGCCLCVCLSAMQPTANKAQYSHLSKILIILQ